jgi:hypothetical protein
MMSDLLGWMTRFLPPLPWRRPEATVAATVHQMVLTLERAGFIRRKPGVARSIQLLFDREDLPIPRQRQLAKTSVLRS